MARSFDCGERLEILGIDGKERRDVLGFCSACGSVSTSSSLAGNSSIVTPECPEPDEVDAW